MKLLGLGSLVCDSFCDSVRMFSQSTAFWKSYHLFIHLMWLLSKYQQNSTENILFIVHDYM